MNSISSIGLPLRARRPTLRIRDQRRRFNLLRSLRGGCLAATLIAAATAQAQAPSGEAVNEANNPLTPKVTLNLHDQWAPRLYDSDDYTNALMLRGVLPHRLFGAPQILRFTLPVLQTVPVLPQGTRNGLGDLNLIDMFLFKAGGMELGFGPQLTIPTASNDHTGTGRWQAGVAAVAIAPQKWGLLGGLLNWQHSFAGDSDRGTQNNLGFQPFFMYNLPQGWYLRSTASWNFNLETDDYVIPLGAGVGKVWALAGGRTVNAFIEPQWTVAHDGAGQPRFQIYAGINFQFPLGQ